MHDKHARKPVDEMRLKENQVGDEAWIKKFLAQGSHGVLATTHEDQPFVTPVLFVYLQAQKAICFHGARTGRLRANLYYNPRVAINVSEFGRILSHEEASEFNLEYRSVTVFGTAALVDDDQEARMILEQLFKKYAPQLEPGKDFHPIQAEELLSTAVYKIAIDTWTGKQQAYTSEYLDAFEYRAVE